jgi:hypothetical protein
MFLTRADEVIDELEAVCRAARLANLIAALSFLANAQDPRIMQQHEGGTKEPRIEIVRVKQMDSSAPRFQFRLSDGLGDLMRGLASTVSTASVMPGRPPVSPKRSTCVMVAGELKAQA